MPCDLSCMLCSGTQECSKSPCFFRHVPQGGTLSNARKAHAERRLPFSADMEIACIQHIGSKLTSRAFKQAHCCSQWPSKCRSTALQTQNCNNPCSPFGPISGGFSYLHACKSADRCTHPNASGGPSMTPSRLVLSCQN